MAYGEWNGMGLHDAGFRQLFERENVLNSDWYQARLDSAQKAAISHWKARAAYLDIQTPDAEILKKRARAAEELRRVSSSQYRQSLVGTIGRDPRLRP